MKEIAFTRQEMTEAATFIATLEKENIMYSLHKETNGFLTVTITGF